jgi:Zn ribbon nucleic-acid-binding protein
MAKCDHNMEIISNGTTMIWEDDTPILASELWECTKCGYTDYEEADNMKHFVDDDNLYAGSDEDIMNQEDDLWTSYDSQNPNHNEDWDDDYEFDDDKELDFDDYQ